MIVRILTGSRDKTLLAREYDLLSTYGLMKGTNRNLLHEYIRALTKQGYLTRPPGEYDVLKTAERADGILFRGEEVLWRRPVGEEPRRQTKKAAASGNREAADQSLFDELRALRAELARQARVPAYVIFPDATLLNLAKEQPTTEEALLAVSGIGEQRAARYGRAVLDVIAAYKAKQTQKAKASGKSEAKPMLRLRPDQLARYVCDPEGISMSAFARRLTELKEPDQPGVLTGRQISDRLLAEGLLTEELADTGRLRRRPTPAGEAAGIILTERAKETGETYIMVTLTEQAQRRLIKNQTEE